MEIEISILNNNSNGSQSVDSPTWHIRKKTYKSDRMDSDIKNCTISHYIDRVIIKDADLSSKAAINDMIEFLKNAEQSFK